MLFLNNADIDGIPLKDMANYYLGISGLFDSDRDIIMNDLYTDGQSYNRAKTNDKKLILQGIILGDVSANLLRLKQCLFKAGLKRMTVSIQGMPNLIMFIDLLNWVSDPNLPEIINCQLVAPDPHMYALSQSILLGATANDSLTFPLTFPLTFGVTTGSQGVVVNTGNVLSYPIITVVGTCSVITLTNTTTGESMSLDVALGASDVLVIDSNPATRSIKLNGVYRMDLKVGDWFSCPPGESTFTFARNSLETKQHCAIAMQSKYI